MFQIKKIVKTPEAQASEYYKTIAFDSPRESNDIGKPIDKLVVSGWVVIPKHQATLKVIASVGNEETIIPVRNPRDDLGAYWGKNITDIAGFRSTLSIPEKCKVVKIKIVADDFELPFSQIELEELATEKTSSTSTKKFFSLRGQNKNK